MFRHHLPVALLVCTLLAGCGGSEPPLSIEIDTTRLGLFAGLASARISLYPPEATCSVVEFSTFETIGIYNQMVSVTGNEEQVEGSVLSILPQTYVVGIWGFNQNNRPIAFGCTENVVIEEGKKTFLAIELRPTR